MKVLDRKLLRDLWQSKGQVAAVAAVIACGIAAFITVLSAHRNLTLSRDTYYQQYRFHDFSIQVEKAPLSAVFRIEALPGVRAVRGRISKDVSLAVPGQQEPKVARILSLPEQTSGIVDGVFVGSGRSLTRDALDECLISDRFFRSNGLRLGERITVTIDGRKQSLKIAGTAFSPEYVYAIRSAQDLVPNPSGFAIVWVPRRFAEMAFDMQGAVHEIVGEVYDQRQLDRLLDQARKVLKPYGVYAATSRADQVSNRFVSDEISSLGATARITPAIFLGVAAMILLVLLGRLVQRERTQIGLLKAYGYTNWSISAHYLKFALVVGLLGCVLGFGVGQWLGRGLMDIYVRYFAFPLLRYRFYPDMFLWALGISSLCACAGALAAVAGVVGISPATAMRDEPQRSAHRILLERVAVLWRRLGFTGKIIARNIFRYPIRSAFTVLGVAISTVLLFIGYFTNDSVDFLLDYHFRHVQREDARVSFFRELGPAALQEARRFPHVRHAEPLLAYPFTIGARWRHKDVLVTGLPPGARLYRLDDLDGAPVRLAPRGLYLTETLARQLEVGRGDTVRLKPLLGKLTWERQVPVAGIVQQYLGMDTYMDLDALGRLLAAPRALNAVMLQVEPGQEHKLATYLKAVPAVAAVAIKQDSRRSLSDTFGESRNTMNVILTGFAGIIALAVIYNATLIGITERRRELASLRVLGFTLAEVGAIVFGENLLLSITGLILGVPLGAAACYRLKDAYDTELFRMPFYISFRTYAVTALAILCFIWLSNRLAWRRIVGLDMVEALKSRE